MTSGGSYGWNEYAPRVDAGSTKSESDLAGRQRPERVEAARAVGIDVTGHQPGDQVLLAHPQRLRGAIELLDRGGRQADEQGPFGRRLPWHNAKDI